MVRAKKYRNAKVAPFSFFDLLFGISGVALLLMILQVVRMVSLVGLSVQEVSDERLQGNRVQEVQAQEQPRGVGQEENSERVARAKQFEEENRLLSDLNTKQESRIKSLEEEVVSLKKLKDEYRALMTDSEKTESYLEVENEQLKQILEETGLYPSDVERRPLTLRSMAFPSMIIGEPMYWPIAVEGGLPPYRWDYKGQLPEGLSFDKENGIIHGRAIKEGDYKFIVQVTDSVGMSVAFPEEMTLSVVERSVEENANLSQWLTVMTILVLFLFLYIFMAHFFWV